MEVIFTALVGSHLYGLDTSTSDKDYKVFVAEEISRIDLGEHEDSEIKPINQLCELLLEPDINFLSLLFSSEIKIEPLYKNGIEQIIAIRENIVRRNLPALYKNTMSKVMAKIGMIKEPDLEKMNYYNKMDMFDTYGYDVKQSMHVFRLLDLLERYSNSGYTEFGNSLIYTGNEKNFLLSIKNGLMKKEEYFTLLENKLASVQALEWSYSKPVDSITDDFLEVMFEEIYKKIIPNIK